MYVLADQACAGPTGKTPPSPQSVARDRAGRRMVQLQVNSGNAAMRGLTDRDWRDFQDLGPQVAYQVANAQQNGAAAFGTKPGTQPGYGGRPMYSGPGGGGDHGNVPVGVEVGGSNPATGANFKKSWVPPGRRGNGGSVSGGMPMFSGPGGGNIENEKAAFVQAFGGDLTPWKTYTGPLPAPGSSMSLTYGGSPSNRSVGFGSQPVLSPDAAAGYYRANCPNPIGVNAIPLGESDYAGASTATSASSGVSNGAMWAIGAVLGLAALSFMTEKHDERKRRKAAK